MNEQQYVLADGIRLHTIKSDKFKVTRLSFSFILPAEKVPITKLTFATMMRGSEKYPTVTDINRRLDELYDSSVVFRIYSEGDRHIFKVYCEMMDEKYLPSGDMTNILDGTLEIIDQIFFHPRLDENGCFDASVVESEKKIACDDIIAKINDPDAYSYERCYETMFPEFASPDGSIEDIEQLTPRMLTDRRKYIFQNAAIECYYIGSRQGAEVAQRLTRLFSNIENRTPETPHYTSLMCNSTEEIKNIAEALPISQGRLTLGLSCDTDMSNGDEFFAMSLFNRIYGSMSISKLFMNLREKKSLCYYCYSNYTVSSRSIMVACGIKPENRDVSYSEIAYQLECMKNGDISERELECAKLSMISACRAISDSPYAIETFKLKNLMSGTDYSIDEYMQKINAVTKAEIIKAASKVKINTVYFLDGDEEECEEGE